MASISTEPNGCRMIEFVMGDRRPRIRLGKVTMKQANATLVKVEDLISAARGAGVINDETSKWLTTIDGKLHTRLAKAGLVQARERSASTLKAFLDQYFVALSVKAGTATAYNHTRRCLVEYFGEGRLLRSISPTDAEKWKQWLRDKGISRKRRKADDGTPKKLSESTINRRVSLARQFFKKAAKWKLVSENPFEDVAGGDQTNRERMFFVTRAMADKVLAACPNRQWKLIFSLSRYGGLRTPSEQLLLKWGDIDFHAKRIHVTSPKTERHPGGAERFIPLFPELEQLLIDAQLEAEPGTDWVVTKARDSGVNLRTHMLRIIRKAGLIPWPKLFHNLRSSRQTELQAVHPSHVVCAWLGNSKKVAENHYLQVTDSDFEKAAQKPAHSASITALQDTSAVVTNPENTAENAVLTCGEGSTMGAEGTEQLQHSRGKSGVVEKTGVNSGALAEILATLTPEQRRQLAAMARSME